jgi:pSer/pThr/pTyr-binding forkhead associated (FHA) protein
VWLDSGGVSRLHAAITIAGSDATLADVGSKNGTTVNGTAVRAAVTLQDGDRLVIGQVPLTYRSAAAAPSTETRDGSIAAAPSFERSK